MRRIIPAILLTACLVGVLMIQARPAAAAQGVSSDPQSIGGGMKNGSPRDALLVTASATAPSIIPVVTSTINSDGSVSHEVQYGQTLLDIASAYNISVSTLLELNGLTETSTIYTGDLLVIVPAPTVTPTPTITETLAPTKIPTRTPRPPTVTPTQTLTPTITITPSPTPVFSMPEIQVTQRTVGFSIIAVCTLGLVLVGLISFRTRKP